MPTINLTLPVSGQGITAGLHATNYAALQALLNGGLDDDNIDEISPSKLSQMAATSGQALVWDGSQWEPGSSGAMTLLHSQTLTATAASFDIQSISQNYNHLKILLQARGDTAATTVAVLMRFNNDSSAVYASEMEQAGANSVSATEAVSSTSAQPALVSAASSTANHAGNMEILIPNYAGTTFFKNWSATGGVSAAITTGQILQLARAGVWASTSAINRITLLPSAGNFIAGTRVTLYGIL